MFSRTVIKIAGEQGMGIESTGMIVMKALKNLGYWVYGEREFNSLIKGGRSNIQINFSDQVIRGISEKINIGLGADREGVLDCLETLTEGGLLIHGFERWQKAIKNLPRIAEEKNLQIVIVPAREIALSEGGNIVMTNVVLLGFLWKVLDLDLEALKSQISKQFYKKPDLIPINHRCAEGGYNFKPENLNLSDNLINLPKPSQTGEDRILIDGNSAIGLGAIQAGVRAYYGYPMSPASSILVYLAKVAPKTSMLVKQLEDEISVAQATLGSSFAGTRAMCATSGGGYDLMTETVSLAAMIETPLVIVLAQRPGPATGLPTWTGQGDLNLAINSSHGEFARIVIACSDPESCYELTQHAHNLAEEFQVPVIILTEAAIAMSFSTHEPFKENLIPIERYISVEESHFVDNLPTKINKQTAEEQKYNLVEKLNSTDRFKLTETGISKRWLPGSSRTIYFANGDEHLEDGSLTEDAQPSSEMIKKRIKKSKVIIAKLSEPKIYDASAELNQPKTSQIGIISWGSNKNTILDALAILHAEETKDISYLHYEYIWPFKTERLQKFLDQSSQTLLIENNYNGQLGQIITAKTGHKFNYKLLQYNGRSISVEQIITKIKEIYKNTNKK